MTKKIRDLDYILAGRLAELIGAMGYVEVRGAEVTFPMRDEDGSLVDFSFDVRGLADRVEENSSDAIVAHGNRRGAQRAALAIIAGNILEDNHDNWDTSETVEVVYRADDYDPIVIDMEDFPPGRGK